MFMGFVVLVQGSACRHWFRARARSARLPSLPCPSSETSTCRSCSSATRRSCTRPSTVAVVSGFGLNRDLARLQWTEAWPGGGYDMIDAEERQWHLCKVARGVQCLISDLVRTGVAAAQRGSARDRAAVSRRKGLADVGTHSDACAGTYAFRVEAVLPSSCSVSRICSHSDASQCLNTNLPTGHNNRPPYWSHDI